MSFREVILVDLYRGFARSRFCVVFICIMVSVRLEKLIFSVIQTDVSRRNGDPIKGPLKHLNTIVL